MAKNKKREEPEEMSRARDLADILLAASLAEFDGPKLKQAIDATFKARASHPVPQQMPDPLERIAASYKQAARELDLRGTHYIGRGIMLNAACAKIGRHGIEFFETLCSHGPLLR
jgi:hypothetical protein